MPCPLGSFLLNDCDSHRGRGFRDDEAASRLISLTSLILASMLGATPEVHRPNGAVLAVAAHDVGDDIRTLFTRTVCVSEIS